jgi:hypothetical protein
MPTETYKSEEAYRKARAYTHIHGIPTHAKEVCIKGGKCHKVNHGKKKVSSTKGGNYKRHWSQKKTKKHSTSKRSH